MIKVTPNPDNLAIGKSLGNHLLNFWFTCTLAKRHGYEVVLPARSEIESVCDVKVKYEGINAKEWQEGTCFNVNTPEEAAVSSTTQLSRINTLLQHGTTENLTLVGNFAHSELFLSEEEYAEFFTIKGPPRQFGDKDVVIHHRGTDFIGHVKHIYHKGITLDSLYYERAIDLAHQQLGKNLKFYVFTDDPDNALVTLPKIDYTISGYGFADAWLAIKHAPNVILSNSTFCWTSSLWGKAFRTMPRGGFNYHYPTGVVPAGFYILGNTYII